MNLEAFIYLLASRIGHTCLPVTFLLAVGACLMFERRLRSYLLAILVLPDISGISGTLKFMRVAVSVFISFHLV